MPRDPRAYLWDAQSAVHGYATVNHETVWRTVSDDLPHLRQVLASMLAARDGT